MRAAHPEQRAGEPGRAAGACGRAAPGDPLWTRNGRTADRTDLRSKHLQTDASIRITLPFRPRRVANEASLGRHRSEEESAWHVASAAERGAVAVEAALVTPLLMLPGLRHHRDVAADAGRGLRRDEPGPRRRPRSRPPRPRQARPPAAPPRPSSGRRRRQRHRRTPAQLPLRTPVNWMLVYQANQYGYPMPANEPDEHHVHAPTASSTSGTPRPTSSSAPAGTWDTSTGQRLRQRRQPQSVGRRHVRPAHLGHRAVRDRRRRHRAQRDAVRAAARPRRAPPGSTRDQAREARRVAAPRGATSRVRRHPRRGDDG